MSRGGRREGSGRKPGIPSAKIANRRALAEKALAGDTTPLEVMLANMRHFHKLAESAEAAITELSADKIAGMKPDEQFKFLLAEVKKAAGLRELSQNCARDAASYIHPRLAAIEHTNKDALESMSLDELREYVRREAAAAGLRDEPFEAFDGSRSPGEPIH